MLIIFRFINARVVRYYRQADTVNTGLYVLEIGEPELTQPAHLYNDKVTKFTNKAIVDKFIQLLAAYNNMLPEAQRITAAEIELGAKDIYNTEKTLAGFLSTDAEREDISKV